MRVWFQIQGSRVRSRPGSILLWFVCVIWFFTSKQQSFSYVGIGLPELNQCSARTDVLAQGHNTVTPVRLEPAAQDWSWRDFNGHSLPERLLSVKSERMCTKYWYTCPGKSVVRWTDRPNLAIAIYWYGNLHPTTPTPTKTSSNDSSYKTTTARLMHVL